MVRVETALKVGVRALTKSLGVEGFVSGYRLANQITERNPSIPVLGQMAMYAGYPLGGWAMEILSPALFNAAIARDKGLGRAAEVATGVVIDILTTYQITAHAPLAQGVLGLAMHVPGLSEVAAFGTAGAFVASRILLSIPEHVGMDTAGPAIAENYGLDTKI